MKSDRRAFVSRMLVFGPVAMTFWTDADVFGAGAADCTLPTGQEPVRFIPDEKQILLRLSAGELADPSRVNQLQNLAKAIDNVRKLPASDVIGWTKQVAQHCISCAPTNASNIHYAWDFLPWHRAMLYFFERILRTYDDNIRLPYWDWENPSSRILPDIYGPKNQPLFWKNRNLDASVWPLTNEQVDVQPLLATPDFQSFGGTASQGKPTPATFSGPHAEVHNNFEPGDMADLQYSPRDPVFYAHHGNIDRLWSSWVAAGHTNPDFGAAKAYFFDEKRQWRYILFNDLRDEAKLGYRYSSLMRPATPVNKFKTMVFSKGGSKLVAQMSDIEEIVKKKEGPHYLFIQNILNLEKLSAEAASFGIFSSKPELGQLATSTKGYLGRASRIRSAGRIAAGPLSISLNITGKAEETFAKGGSSVELTVAPLDAKRRISSPGAPLVADMVQLLG